MIDVRKTRADILNGKESLEAQVEEYLGVIEERNTTVNAFVSTYPDSARSQANAITAKIREGSAGPLAGMVLGIKDVISEKGKMTTCASHILHNFESVYDATVITKLRDADALLLGRLNMDEFAMGSSNENSAFGPVRNPHDETRVPGGSSGGSAAAVAAGMCSAALGSDTGGSVRQPASYCGVVGLKPTYGRVSRYGLVAFASSFDCIGPVTTSVEDAASLLNVLAGYDERDNTSSSEPVPDYHHAMESVSRPMTIGVPEEYFGDGLDDEIRNLIDDRLSQLEKSGEIKLKSIHLPHSKYNIATYYILATAEASSNLARYDGVRFGHRSDMNELKEEYYSEKRALEEKLKVAAGDDRLELSEKMDKIDSLLVRLYKKSRTEGFGREVKRRIMLGTYVLSAGYYDAYYAKAQKVRRLILNDFQEAFKGVDAIVSPTAPTTAFELGSNPDDPVQMYLNDIYTTSANLAGICGISVPAGFHSNGLPVGIQFMGNAFEEGKILQAAKLIQSQ